MASVAAAVSTYADKDVRGVEYNLIPTEQDANAAAYDFIVSTVGSDVVAEVAKANPGHPSLRPGNRAIRADELSEQLITFLADRHETCRRYIAAGSFAHDPRGPDGAFASIVDLEAKGAGAKWLRKVHGASQ